VKDETKQRLDVVWLPDLCGCPCDGSGGVRASEYFGLNYIVVGQEFDQRATASVMPYIVGPPRSWRRLLHLPSCFSRNGIEASSVDIGVISAPQLPNKTPRGPQLAPWVLGYLGYLGFYFLIITEGQKYFFRTSCDVCIGVYNRGMDRSSRTLIKILEADGWQLVRSKGDHHQFRHPTKPGTVTVQHPKKEILIKTFNSALKQAGLK
jgi:predicted RNA binding protein YcfA (HicA-like mRNA interferase family)